MIVKVFVLLNFLVAFFYPFNEVKKGQILPKVYKGICLAQLSGGILLPIQGGQKRSDLTQSL